ncbi:JAB domain-containing protein [Macrococcus capreoli]
MDIEFLVDIQDVVLVEKESDYVMEKIKNPEMVAKMAQRHIGNCTREKFMILGLNTQNKPIFIYTVSIGCVNASIVSPREIFQIAILKNCTNIIAVHNHPSGDPTPSQEDIEVTKRIVECGELLGIHLLDHIIVAFNSNKFVSLRTEGIY